MATLADVAVPVLGGGWYPWGLEVDGTIRELESRTAPTLAGMYAGWDASATITTFETTNGVNVPYGHEFGDHTTWSYFETGTNFANWETWVNAKAGRRFTYSCPLLPGDLGISAATAYANLAAGTYDSHFTTLGAAFQARPGLRNAIVRLGWEFNGSTFPWSIPAADATTLANYKTGFGKAVTALRSQCPTLEIEWAPNCQLDSTNRPFDELWPGAAYVDYVGIGLYDYLFGSDVPGTINDDTRWAWARDGGSGVNGLTHQVAIARKYGKKLAHTEWGLWPTGSNNGGGDRPEFIHRIAAWYRDHGYSYQIYNNVNATADHRLVTYPKSLRAYLAEL